MMMVLLHRGKDSFGISTTNGLARSRDLSDLKSLELDSPVAIGYNLMKVLSVDVPQPCELSNGALSFDGEIYSQSSVVGIEEIARESGSGIDQDFYANLVRREEGAYAIAALVDHGILLARDPLGLKPLYYGECPEFYAAASECKALRGVGIDSPRFFPPGHLAFMTSNSTLLRPVKTVQTSPSREAASGTETARVYHQLMNSVRARTSDIDKVAVAFSGGLDSGFVAFLANSLNKEVVLISVGIRGSYDLAHAEETAQELKVPIISKAFHEEDLDEAVGQTLWYIEDSNPMKVEVGVAIGWVASIAAKEGYKVILTGQGGDELFAGYSRFARIYDSKGPEAAKEAVVKSVVEAHLTNYTRDEQVSMPYRVRIRHPFADWELTRLALSIPIELNLNKGSDPLRKRVLRESARLAGTPCSIVEAPKRAVQYGSGIHNALSKIAKTRHLSTKRLLEKLYSEFSWQRAPIL